jgi:hypothetical protein
MGGIRIPNITASPVIFYSCDIAAAVLLGMVHCLDIYTPPFWHARSICILAIVAASALPKARLRTLISAHLTQLPRDLVYSYCKISNELISGKKKYHVPLSTPVA